MPNEFKERMREAVERGETTPLEAYEHVRDVALDQADLRRKAAKENPAVSEAEVLQTYVLQLLGPKDTPYPRGLSLAVIMETEENLTDLLPEGYSVLIRAWDEEE